MSSAGSSKISPKVILKGITKGHVEGQTRVGDHSERAAMAATASSRKRAAPAGGNTRSVRGGVDHT